MRDVDTPPERESPFPTFPAQDEDGQTEAPSIGFREGLPKSYQSRHDRHYVDELSATSESQPVRLVAVSRIDAADLPAEHAVADLAKSVAELGLLQPLLVRPHDGRFRLIAGRRRLAAARRAGLADVPCLVHAVSDARASELAAADNLRAEEALTSKAHQAAALELQTPVDPQTVAMMSELADAVASVQSCLPLLGHPSATTRERVALALVSVETERALWTLRARQYPHRRCPWRTPLSVVRRCSIR